MQRCVEAVFCGENKGSINNKLKYKIKLKLSFQKQQSSQLKFCAMMEVLMLM